GLAEADAHEPRTLAPAAQDDAVTILEERARLATCKRDGLPAAGGQLQQRSRRGRLRARLCTGPQQIPWLQVAAIHGVVSEHLAHRPPRVAKARVRQALRRCAVRAHARRLEPCLELNIESACGAPGITVDIAEGRGPARRPAPGNAKGRERLERHYPGRDRRCEALAEKRAERLIFPRLYVARRPVVQQAQAEHVALRLRNGYRLTERISTADEHTELQLVVE